MKKSEILLCSIFLINTFLTIIMFGYDLYPNQLFSFLDLTETIITDFIILYLIIVEKK
jgi:hypothetical protein